jgi:hypothetical protein
MKSIVFGLCLFAATYASAQKTIAFGQIKGKVFEFAETVVNGKKNVVIYDSNKTGILVDDDGKEATFSASGSPAYLLSALYVNYFLRCVYDDKRDGEMRRIYLMEHR